MVGIAKPEKVLLFHNAQVYYFLLFLCTNSLVSFGAVYCRRSHGESEASSAYYYKPLNDTDFSAILLTLYITV